MNNFRAPWWQLGGHMQTIAPALLARRRLQDGTVALNWRRERWETPDGDFVDVDWGTHLLAPQAPTLVLFHGLEGSSRSHYAQAMAQVCAHRGWQIAVPHFRGCSGVPNRLARAYHSGDAQEVDWILRRMRSRTEHGLLAVGVSLGGNALTRWAGLQQQAAAQVVQALAVVSAPLDLVATGEQLGRGLNCLIYTRMFMRSLVPKALAKWQQFPGLFDRQKLLAARDLKAFDDVFTAPVHGFVDAYDYWRQASAKPLLAQVAVPMLVLNARNDPLVPSSSCPIRAEVSACVELWQPVHGGHVGFGAGAFPGHVLAMPQAITDWMQQWLDSASEKEQGASAWTTS